MMDFVFKMMSFALNVMNFVLKMMDFVQPNLPGAAGCWGPAGNGWQHGLGRKSTVCEEFAGVMIDFGFNIEGFCI